MTDSIDKKSKEKQGNLDVDLDAMLDETSSPLSMNEFEDDDAIDRLLLDTGFDADDALIEDDANKNEPVIKDDDFYDELDDFLSFEGFGDDPVEPGKKIEALDQSLGDSSLTSLTQSQDDEDATDRFMVNSGFDADRVSNSAGVEASDDLSNSSDFNEPEIVSELKSGEPEQVIENSSTVDVDDLDQFLGLSDDLDDSDLTADVEIDRPTPVVAESSESSVIEDLEVDASLLEEQDEFTDFSDFNEPETASFDKSRLLEDDELNSSAPVMADLTAPEEKSDMKEDADVGLALEFKDLEELDRIQDEDVEVDTHEPDDEQQTVSDELFSDLQGDENSVNKPFEDAGSDVEELFEQTVLEKDELGEDADSNEFFNQTNEIQSDENDEPLPRDDDFLLPDFDITADSEDFDLDSNAGTEEALIDPFESETGVVSLEANETVAELKPEHPADTVPEKVENVTLSSPDIAKQLEDAETKVKKARLFNYMVLGFGAVSLGAASLLGVITYGAKTEVSKLAETVATLQQNLEKVTASNPNVEIEAMRNSVVLLNQQVNGFITELKGSPQFPIDVLNNKVPDIAAKQVMVSKALEMLQLKMGGNVASEPIVVAEWPKIEAAHESMSVKVPHVQEISPIKPEVEHEQLATKKAVAHEQTPTKEVVGHDHAPTKESVVHDTIPIKTEAPHETATTKVKAQPEEIKANPEVAKAKPEVVKVKPITPEKVVVKKGPVKEKIQEIPGKWGVNLVAFKQEWFAKSKAAEFAQQGIYAEVIPVHEKNTTMYRLRVGGFKSKKEAYSNTDRIKKLLNLDSVWVSDN